MIPAEAVEAAAKALADRNRCPKEWQFYLSEARSALEAAAAHLNAAAWDACVDEAEALGWVHEAGAADTKARNPYRNGS